MEEALEQKNCAQTINKILKFYALSYNKSL